MKILFISSKTGWGGIMSWMVHSAEGLSSRGHNVWIISNPKSKLNKENYPKLNIIEKSFGPDYNPIAIYQLTKFIKTNAIDITISNIRKEVIVAGIAAKLSGIKNIRRIGNPNDVNKRTRKLHKFLVSNTIVPCNNVYEVAALNEKWPVRSDFTTIYNGRDIKEFLKKEIDEVRNSWGVSSDEIVIGTTSKLSPIKNIQGLIKAFDQLIKKYDNIKLIITGNGSEKENLKKEVSSLNFNSKIKFIEFSNNAQLIASCYDIAILNSFDEGFPNSLVEYMSVGAPSISTNVGGVSEIIVDGENGYLVKSNDKKQLEEKIAFLIENPEKRVKIGRNAKKTIAKNFSKQKMIDDLELLLNRLVNNV